MSDPVTLALTILAVLLGAAVVTALMSGSAACKKFAHAPIVVACGAGAVSVVELQHPGCRRATAAQYLAAHRLAPGMRFGAAH